MNEHETPEEGGTQHQAQRSEAGTQQREHTQAYGSHGGQTYGSQGGIAREAVQGVGGGLVAVVDATENILEGVVRAAGRLGTATVEEIFSVIGTVVGGTGQMFQGNIGRRERDTGRRDIARDERREDVRTGSTTF